MTREVDFFVPGRPATAGSKRAFNNPKTGRPIIVDDNKRSRPWKTDVAAVARDYFADDLLTGPIDLKLYFCFSRPKSHYGTGRNAARLKPSAPAMHTVKPDCSKLTRAVEDALSGVIYRDDSQIAVLHVEKVYTEQSEGVRVVIREIG